ncbi:hypothetical protein BKA56DRAFT_592743 [Ilyonectria sp. MPI-CAGE-AT-0026]|nr:hypothetical protein BKA56DRAFT_592743 [Ilyonectria sp. MPI-CAGE-AT-0026]
MMAVQLNDPVYSVTVTFPGIPAPSTTAGPHAGTSGATESEIYATPTAKQPSKITVQYLEWLQSQKDMGVTSRLELPVPTQGSRIAQAVQRQRSGRSASSLRPLPPPHTRPIRKTPPLSSPPPDVITDPSNRPQFQYGTWPVTSVSSSVGTTPPPVPTTPTPQDLVVSVQLPPNQRTVAAFFLTRITVSIPYGHIRNPQNRTNLFADYGGTAPVMLSNLRFNVQASYSTDNIGPIMVLTIVPRVVSGSVGIAVINEMSVLLPEVVVNPYKTPGLFVEVAVEEDYTTPFGPKTYTTSWKVYLDVSASRASK